MGVPPTDAPALPTGTVTFLFTDIEGSTQRWEARRDAMQAALQQHDRILGDAVARHAGSVFKTVGDALFAVFPTVQGAIEAAVDMQRALSSQDWSAVDGLPVRMAIHTGVAQERSGDYFGPTVNRVARLLAVGHGGQILLSGVAKELAEGAMPSRAALRDLGSHRLKDLTHPEQVYQLVAPDLKADFPPLRSLESLPNNLPLQLTSFIGRDEDIAEIETALAESRLVTLLGAGGIGKTRLSLQVGANVLDHFPDGVWFVELAPLTDAALVDETVATVLGLSHQGERAPAELIVSFLRDKQALIILDNCEHVVAQAARVADVVMRGAPKTRILASSREALAVDGETALRVASLAVPPDDRRLSAQSALEYGAIGLFVDRARSADRRFSLTDDNVETVAEICRQLDGIALAIELAAPRVKVLSVEQLAARLNERFRLLTGGSRTALPRQQTMRALIDWSYDLLTPDEKAVFCRASVFAGSFSLDAAGNVCAGGALESWDVLDILSSLVDKSLLTADLAGSEQRYRMLVSTRQYAGERLTETTEHMTIRRKHAEFYAALAAQAAGTYESTPTRRWRSGIDVEFENVRAALDWSLVEGNDPPLGIAMTISLRWYWPLARRFAEASTRLETALAASDTGEPNLDHLHLACTLAYFLNSYAMYGRSRALAASARQEAEILGDDFGLALALTSEAASAFTDPTFDANAPYDRAEAIFTRLGHKRLAGGCLFGRARSASVRENTDLPATRKLFHDALAIFRSTGDEPRITSTLNNLGELAFRQGHVDEAVRLATESNEYAIGLGMPSLVATNSANLSAYSIARDRDAEALTFAREALRLSVENELPGFARIVADHFAALAARAGHDELSARLAGAAMGGYEAIGADAEPTEMEMRAKTMALLNDRLAPRLAALLAEGRAWSEEQLVAGMRSVQASA